MANLETLLEFKPTGKVKKSGETVMGVYADQEVLDNLRDLCLGNCHSFAPCTDIEEAEHILKNCGKGYYDPIAVDISLAEQDGYKFIKLLKADQFRNVKVYVTHGADFAKTRLDEVQKHMWGNALLVQWPKTEAGSSSQAANLGVLEPKNACPKTQAVSTSETVDFGVLEPKNVPSETQTGSSSQADLSVLKDLTYNDPEDAIVSSDIQLGLPEDDDVSTKLQLGFTAKRKRDTNDPEE